MSYKLVEITAFSYAADSLTFAAVIFNGVSTTLTRQRPVIQL